MKLRTLGLAVVAMAFISGEALAQAGTMQPIPNPPEKHKMMKHKKKAAKKAEASADKADAKDAKADAKADAKMPAKK